MGSEMGGSGRKWEKEDMGNSGWYVKYKKNEWKLFVEIGFFSHSIIIQGNKNNLFDFD